MKIDEKYSVRSDTYNWVITEKYLGKDGDGNEKHHTRDHFFPNLSRCVNWLINNNCKQAASLQEIKEELEKAEAICKEVLHKVQRF
ncbi:MAG: hypothetical protein COB36_10900 [Alphaproteobacteria bacterium]|nr:MAG: hypothetical protein COB36_10900 [Alphaproteobacteria bacterium]